MITVSMTRNASNANWSWRRTPIFFGRVTVPFVGLDLAGQDLHERGLAGAVRPGDRVAAAGEERGGDVFEQDAGAVAHGDVVD